MSFTIRDATVQDVPLIRQLILELARYEKLEHEMKASEEMLRKSLFEEKAAECRIGEEDGSPIAFSLFFHNFSTFVGRKGLYIEDIYVRPAYRSKGFGEIMLRDLTRIAKERNCGRMEWSVLDWNTPAINFYKKMGAVPMDEWTVFRLSENEILRLCSE